MYVVRLADNLAALRRFATGLLKQHPAKHSLKSKQRIAGWNPDFLAEVLALQTTSCALTFSCGGTWINVPGGATIADMEEQLRDAFSNIAANVPPPKLVYQEDSGN